MTELLYQTDSYLNDFEALVTAVDLENRGLVLDRTAFYPGGGGQPADSGVLRAGDLELRVPRIKRIAGALVHIIEGDDPLPEVGDLVNGSLDWDRRYQLMRTHSALHVLCGVVFRDYGASVTGGDMDPLQGRMDFEFETMHRDLVDEIESAINEEVRKGHDIKVDILPREQAFQIPDLIRTKINLLPEGIQQVRVVEIEDLDLQADGGTHVRNTTEIGRIRVVDYKSKGKINKRIYIEVQDA
jgi:misacylated tRNA(Ala) deacylase